MGWEDGEGHGLKVAEGKRVGRWLKALLYPTCIVSNDQLKEQRNSLCSACSVMRSTRSDVHASTGLAGWLDAWLLRCVQAGRGGQGPWQPLEAAGAGQVERKKGVRGTCRQGALRSSNGRRGCCSRHAPPPPPGNVGPLFLAHRAPLQPLPAPPPTSGDTSAAPGRPARCR